LPDRRAESVTVNVCGYERIMYVVDICLTVLSFVPRYGETRCIEFDEAPVAFFLPFAGSCQKRLDY